MCYLQFLSVISMLLLMQILSETPKRKETIGDKKKTKKIKKILKTHKLPLQYSKKNNMTKMNDKNISNKISNVK